MFVTESMLARNLMQSLAQSQTQMSQLEADIASGQKIHMPSDNPSGTQVLLSLKAQLDSLQTYQNNIQDGTGWLKATGAAVGQLQSIAQSAQTLAVAQSTSSTNATDRQAAATQVSSLLDEAISAANTRYQGVYLFSGTANTLPFSLSAGSVTYSGNAQPLVRTVGAQSTVNVTLTGGDLTGTGLFSSLSQLKTDLLGDNASGISADVASLQHSVTQLTSLAATVGARQSALGDFQKAASAQTNSLQTLQGQVDGVQPTQAITQFMQSRSAYEQALAIGAQILTPSLITHLFP